MKSTVVQCHEADVLRKINFLFRKKNFRMVSQQENREEGVFRYNVRQRSWFFSEQFTFIVNRINDSNMRIEFSAEGGETAGLQKLAHQKELRMMESIYRMF